MSSLWTPYGEHEPEDHASEPPGAAAEQGGPGPPTGGGEPDEEQMREMLTQLLATPVEAIVTQLVVQLQEIALLHLSLAQERPESLPQARLAIDAMAALVEGVGDRLGPNAEPLGRALTNVQLAFVDVAGSGAGEE